MPNWNRSTWGVSAVVAMAVYFSAALWLKYSYVEPPKPAGAVFRLDRPFLKMEGSDLAFNVKAPSLDQLSDTLESETKSPFLLYENTTPLGPAHAEHAEIGKYVHGRFSHWTGAGLIFSSSDVTNPLTNGLT